MDIDEIKTLFLSMLTNMESCKDKIEHFLFVWDENFSMVAIDDDTYLSCYSSEPELNGFYNAAVVVFQMWARALYISNKSRAEVVTEVSELFDNLLSAVRNFSNENIH